MNLLLSLKIFVKIPNDDRLAAIQTRRDRGPVTGNRRAVIWS
jgi:hypothetical protein